jgi:RNA polymerase sigma factor (TIGR02999 family)
MESLGSGEVTRILSGKDRLSREEALEQLLPVVYDELRALAGARLRHERSDHSLQATALVHEAYIRLVGWEQQSWIDRAHFYRAAAEAMRRILIDHARGRARGKRGGGRVRVDLEDANLATWDDPDDVLALDEALHRLMEQDPRAAEIVQLRFFAGLSVEETAKALELSIRTVHREWKFARTWLFRALGEADD